jgi:hypothetical protein
MNDAPDEREYAAHVARTSAVLEIAGIPWVSRGRVLRPLSMPHRMRAIPREGVRAAIREVGARLAQWTEEWDVGPCDWWHVCCDRQDYGIDQLGKSVRYDTRRGLERCEVRRVDPEWFATAGFAVYAAAFRRYGTLPPMDQSGFTVEFREHALYRGRETWGAFVGGTLVAWASCIVIGDAVDLASWKSDPEYYKARPNNALLYALTHHYLGERGVRYVMSGSRSLLHQTRVQDFEEKMGYRRVYCPLRIELSPATAAVNALGLPGWARRLRMPLGSLTRLQALDAAVRISRSCRKVGVPAGRTQGPPAGESSL